MTRLPAIDVSQEQWDIVRGVLSRHLPGTEVWAFGSRAKWSAKAYSDLDLAAITDRPLPLAVTAAIADEFANSNLPWKVDLVDWAAISEGFRAIVARDKVVVQPKTDAPDSAHWPLVPISSVASVFDGPHATPEKATNGPVFLGITCLDDGRLDLRHAEHVSEDDFATWTRRVAPRGGDVVFSYETKIGAAAIVPDGLRCCLGRRMGLVRPDSTRLDARFFLYQYLGPEFQSLLRSRTIHGSTVDRISIKEFPDFEIRLPPLPAQKNIARVLGSLDDKIELNRRMNDTLEAMARAIFQSWFVDFDPVRATAVDLIEEGALAIGDGYRAKNDELGTEGVPFIRAAELNNGFDTQGADRLRPDRLAAAKGKFARVGDVAFTSKGTVGRFARVGECTELFVYSPQICFWRSLDPQIIHPAVLYCWMQSSEFVSQIDGASGQTDMAPYVSLRDQKSMKVPRFHESQHALGESISPLLRMVSERQAENRTLEMLRDSLLPKLLSGELSPAEALA